MGDGSHLGLVDQYAMTLHASYAPTEVATSLFPQYGRNLLNVGVFIFASLMQSDLDRSTHYLGILVTLFAGCVVMQAISERLRVIAAQPRFHKETLALLLIELIGMVVAYLSGTLIGMLTDVFRHTPSRGHFEVLNLVLPVTVLVLTVTRLYWLNMISAARSDIADVIIRERASRDRKDA